VISPSGRLVVGSRGSRLALVQAEWVRDRLGAAHTGLEVVIEEISTKGDKILDAPLAKIGDKGLFTKELETALLDGRIDVAVHSAKDMPTELPEGLALGAFTEREDVHDAFVGVGSGGAGSLADLVPQARVGSSSLRRRAQLLALRPDLELTDIRGNVETRLRKIDEQGLAGTVLALAGLRRLGRDEIVSFVFDFEEMLPAVGQGALAIEMRAHDERVAALVAPLDDHPTRLAVSAERALMRALEGGCQVPIGAHGELARDGIAGRELRLRAFVGSLDGQLSVRDELSGAAGDPEALGRALAARLLESGADRILEAVRGAAAGEPLQLT
jgi:hydroxymethylbilane synthase